MLYVFHGSDIPASVKKAHSLVASLRAKKADASYVELNADNWSAAAIEEHLGGQGLFSNKYIIFLDRLTEKTEAAEALPDFIPVMNESANIFIMLEGKLKVDLKKAIDKSAEKVVVSDVLEKAPAKNVFNIFALADAFGSRDSFKAWSIYRQAIEAGNEPENIIGTLFWQVKSMLLARNAKSAGECGLSPFVFSKSKKAAGNFGAGELESCVENLIIIYHDSHRGLVDGELGLERMMLSLHKT